MHQSDILIIGGGIVGLATAYQIKQTFPNKTITLLEKEKELANHQTGNNSGVLHSGIYYKPGSHKAKNCIGGKKAMQDFCKQNEIPFDICGKVIVAFAEKEFTALDNIYKRGQENGVRCEMIDKQKLQQLEPHCAGIKAIHVPDAGIVDYKAVCNKLGEKVSSNSDKVVTGARVIGIEHRSNESVASTTAGDFGGKLIINCAGLHCDRVTKLGGQNPNAKIVPFRGEYYELTKEAEGLCKNLIYPVPDPKFPFLGVHFTRMISGGVECGPNAVLAFAREGYRMGKINFGDLFESLTYPGFLRMAAKHWAMGMGEIWRSINKGAFVKALQRLIPEIQSKDLVQAPAGVRAQAVTPDGGLVDDFLIVENEQMVNVLNAPSPAATASLWIGKSICEKLEPRFS